MEGLLYQVAPRDRGLALRGANVTIVTYSASATEVLWQGRILSHTTSSKAVRQHEAVNGKDVNGRVDIALGRRTTPQPIGHPWQQKMATALGQTLPRAQFEHTKAHMVPAS